MTKKGIAIILMLTLLMPTIGSVAFAAGISSGIGTELIQDVYTELGIRSVLQRYFNQRESLLAGTISHIDAASTGVNGDETAHRELLYTEGIIRISSSISIDVAECYDSHAEAFVTETVEYMLQGISHTESIEHKIQLGQLDDGKIIVVRDGYLETASGFRSCSYVPPEVIQAFSNRTVSIMSVTGSNCIVATAENEVGFVEGPNNDTKYGDACGMPNCEWCHAFVAWCARQVGVPKTVIPNYTGSWDVQDFFETAGVFHLRRSGYAPQPGDLFFGTEDGVGVSHGGIIAAVDSQYIYTIHGNHPDTVEAQAFALTDTYILGYANPNYGTSGHDWPTSWTNNGTNHSKECTHCERVLTTEAHSYTWKSNANQHWRACECGHTLTPAGHLMVQDENLSGSKCRICGYVQFDYIIYEEG